MIRNILEEKCIALEWRVHIHVVNRTSVEFNYDGNAYLLNGTWGKNVSQPVRMTAFFTLNDGIVRMGT